MNRILDAFEIKFFKFTSAFLPYYEIAMDNYFIIVEVSYFLIHCPFTHTAVPVWPVWPNFWFKNEKASLEFFYMSAESMSRLTIGAYLSLYLKNRQKKKIIHEVKG